MYIYIYIYIYTHIYFFVKGLFMLVQIKKDVKLPFLPPSPQALGYICNNIGKANNAIYRLSKDPVGLKVRLGFGFLCTYLILKSVICSSPNQERRGDHCCVWLWFSRTGEACRGIEEA